MLYTKCVSELGYNRLNLGTYSDWKDTPCIDTVTEYAGRVCYKSDENMFRAKDYIKARIREGHEDIAEHPWISFALRNKENTRTHIQEWLEYRPRHMNVVKSLVRLGEDWCVVGGTARTWLQFLRKERVPTTDAMVRMEAEIKRILLGYGPNTFAEFNGIIKPGQDAGFSRCHDDFKEPFRVTDTGAQVTMIARSKSTVGHHDILSNAVFEIDYISRAATHQLVRHRLASFSQESQRYVDLEKAGSDFIYPEAWYLNEEQHEKVMSLFEEFERETRRLYRGMRDAGLRKEDARCILPNAISSRIVMSGSLEALRHFVWLRCDKAAQIEIRLIALEMLAMLHSQFPGCFDREMERFHVQA